MVLKKNNKKKWKNPDIVFWEKISFKNVIFYGFFYWIFGCDNVSFLVVKFALGKFAQDSIISLEILHKQNGGWNETFN